MERLEYISLPDREETRASLITMLANCRWSGERKLLNHNPDPHNQQYRCDFDIIAKVTVLQFLLAKEHVTREEARDSVVDRFGDEAGPYVCGAFNLIGDMCRHVVDEADAEVWGRLAVGE